jgi:uncharacterized damage-inducible protein DinB
MNDTTLMSKAEVFSNMFQFQSSIFHNALVQLTQEDSLKRPSPQSNHINWLLGHIVHCRYMIAGMIGVKAENPFGNRYWTPIDDASYPTLREIVETFPIISEKLLDRLSGMTNEDLEVSPAPGQPSWSDIVSFFVYHEAYHLGQIGYARKLIGLEAMKSN